MSWFKQLIVSLKRLPQILFHPDIYFANFRLPLFDGIVVIVILFLGTLFQKLLWVESSTGGLSIGWALEQAAANSLLVWSIFFTVYYAVSTLFKKNVNPIDLVGWIGSAGLPLAVTTLISALSWLIGRFFNLSLIMPIWLNIQNILAWIGLALSWPGLFGYFLLYDGLKLKKLWAVLIPGGIFAIILLGWFLPSI